MEIYQIPHLWTSPNLFCRSDEWWWTPFKFSWTFFLNGMISNINLIFQKMKMKVSKTMTCVTLNLLYILVMDLHTSMGYLTYNPFMPGDLYDKCRPDLRSFWNDIKNQSWIHYMVKGDLGVGLKPIFFLQIFLEKFSGHKNILPKWSDTFGRCMHERVNKSTWNSAK